MWLIDFMYLFNKKKHIDGIVGTCILISLVLATYMSIIFCQHENDTTTRETRDRQSYCTAFLSSRLVAISNSRYSRPTIRQRYPLVGIVSCNTLLLL